MYQVNYTHCINAEKENYRFNNLWYGMNSTYNFGCMTYLYKKYNCPSTYQAFYESYINDYEGNDSRTHGRNEEYIKHQATLLAEKDGNKRPKGTYYNYIVKKLIIDTLDGSKKENELKEMLNKSNFQTKEPSYVEDTKYGIDKFIYKDGKLLCIAQIKPNTFFIGNNNDSLINDRINALKKETYCNNTYNVPVVYFIYNKKDGHWILNDKGNKGHKLKNLINNDGTAKKNY